MGAPLYHVDAFTDAPFGGNPAAVVVLGGSADPSAAWMQRVAAEMNLSETAFLVQQEGGWSLRWFTPRVEVDLCGHATLASAHVLWSEQLATDEQLPFHTRSGVLTATQVGNQIELDFPALISETVPEPPGLRDALGAEPVATARNVHDLLVELADAATVRALAPDFAAIAGIDVRAVVVTARSDDPAYDFVSRCFAPRVGINEDPVTGSAHCALAQYWGTQLAKMEMRAFQASARGGSMHVRLDGDRVVLTGSAVTITQGELLA